MAFLELLNINELLGNTPELETFKRSNDKLDGYLSAAQMLVGVTVFTIIWGNDQLVCVPSVCESDPTNAACAKKWEYQTGQCEDEVLSWPDTNFHYLLVLVAVMFFGLLGLPIYWGHSSCKEIFSEFYKAWSVLTDSKEEAKDVEWRRSMHLLYDQLKTGMLLSSRYAAYHAIGLFADILSLAVVVLYTLHFSEYDLQSSMSMGTIIQSNSSQVDFASSYFQLTKKTCLEDQFICDLPNQNIFKWFGIISAMVIFLKVVVNLRSLMFCLGLPGFFGRNFLIYAGQLTDTQHQRLFFIQLNPITIVTHSGIAILRKIFVAPLLKIFAFAKLCFKTGKKNAQKTISKSLTKMHMKKDHVVNNYGTLDEGADDEVEVLNEDMDNTHVAIKPKVPTEAQNWCDLFFILDILASNVDPCDVLVFLSKIDDHILDFEEKNIDEENSYFDSSTNTLSIVFLHGGIIETLIGYFF